MDLYNYFRENGGINVTISAEQLMSCIDYAIQQTKKELEDLVVSEKNEVYLSVEQTAEMLSVDKSTLWRWEKVGYLIPSRIGGKNRYPRSEIVELLKNGGRQPNKK